MIGTLLAAALRILPLGDSITEGSNNQANYRIPLCQKLEAKGYRLAKKFDLSAEGMPPPTRSAVSKSG